MMEAPQKKSSAAKVAALAVLVVLVVSILALYSDSTARSNNTLSSEVGSLEAEVSSLKQANSNLQSQLTQSSTSSTSTSTTTANGSTMSPEGLYAYAGPSVVTIQGYELLTESTFFGTFTSIESVQGSGFVTEFQGSPYVVTNFHVVDGVTNITVTFSDGNSYPAAVKGSDEYSDLAVLSVDAPASVLVPLQIVNSTSPVSVGESVYAIGSPFGLSGSMTYGIVSQVGRTITEDTPDEPTISNVIQFSAPINPGNSGGPLLNDYGQVVGITTATVSDSEGLGFAIPSTAIEREISSLVTNGDYLLHPYIGINGTDMSYQLAQDMKTNVTYGVLVESVVSGGPAATAGIRAGNSTATIEGTQYIVGGDIIVSINGVNIVDTDALGSYLAAFASAGQTVDIGIVRSGSNITIPVTLGTLPNSG